MNIYQLEPGMMIEAGHRLYLVTEVFVRDLHPDDREITLYDINRRKVVHPSVSAIEHHNQLWIEPKHTITKVFGKEDVVIYPIRKAGL